MSYEESEKITEIIIPQDNQHQNNTVASKKKTNNKIMVPALLFVGTIILIVFGKNSCLLLKLLSING